MNELKTKILLLYYYGNLTLKEIANVLNLSESEVSQIHAETFQQLIYNLSEIEKQTALLSKLPEKERRVVILYCYCDLTLKEIAKLLDLSEGKVAQIHTKAVQQLRSSL